MNMCEKNRTQGEIDYFIGNYDEVIKLRLCEHSNFVFPVEECK